MEDICGCVDYRKIFKESFISPGPNLKLISSGLNVLGGSVDFANVFRASCEIFG